MILYKRAQFSLQDEIPILTGVDFELHSHPRHTLHERYHLNMMEKQIEVNKTRKKEERERHDKLEMGTEQTAQRAAEKMIE